MKRLASLLIVTLLLGACTARQIAKLPTRAVLPTVTPTDIPPTPFPTAVELTAVEIVSAVPTLTLILPPTPVTLGDVPAMERRLRETPVFANLTTDRVRATFALGKALGNRANVFTTIVDSNTTNGDFLQPIGMNPDAYCTWGDYADLRATVDYFSLPPDAASANSFTHHSIAAQKGFSTSSVLDPFWAGGECDPNESPLVCEYRAVQPSVAIIMLGGIDVSDLATADYRANIQSIVDISLQKGVIPVLTTFIVLPERDTVYPKSLEFNMALLDIAQSEQVPLINLWAAAQTLPDEGIGPDHTHLKARVGSFCAFDGAQAELGGTLRNLLTLQALDTLRRSVLGG